MINEFVIKLEKVKHNPNEYYNILNEIISELNTHEYKKRSIINELLLNIEEYFDSKILVTVIDIFLQLKSNEILTKENIDKVNCKFIEIYNKIEDEDTRYYLLGYILQNNLDSEEIKKDDKLSEFLKDRLEEKELSDCIIRAIRNKNWQSSYAIESWIKQLKNDENIFKIGELVREKIFENEILSRTMLTDFLNEIILDILKRIDYYDENIEKILNFVFSIYQDEDFVTEYVTENNVPIINKIISQLDNKFLDNMFIELTETCEFNKIANKPKKHIYGNEHKSNHMLVSAARGEKITVDDYSKLDRYLNRTLKYNKKLNKINMKYSYDAREILSITKENNEGSINLMNIINKLNIQYYEDSFEGDILGFSFKLKSHGKASIIINKNCDVDVRKRFTIAHEIGHICTNSDKDITNEDNIYNIHIYNEDERKVNNFAGELLIPIGNLSNIFNKDITIQTVEEVAKKYNTSIEVAGIRCIKEIDGSYIFAVYNNKGLKYNYSSESAHMIELSEDINEFIMSENQNVTGQWIGNEAKVSIKINDEYKYAVVNYIYK